MLVAQPDYERKLAAIFYADVAGYSRLTGQDEEATHRILGQSLDFISATIEKRHGHVVHYAGDAVLAEFQSVALALECAAEIQNELRTRNQALPEAQRLQFRIGINIGEVIVDRNDIYGNGVNVAARLESLADPGGICISEIVYEQVRRQSLSLGYESLGEKQVKNIAEPVHAYRVLLEPSANTATSPPGGFRRGRSIAVVVVLLITAGAGVGGWLWLQEPSTTVMLQNEPDTARETSKQLLWTAGAAPNLPAKPSIAVLPFANLSDNPEQAYFSDGLTNDLITDLSKFHELFVISGNTMSTFKDKPVTVPDLGHELGVRYVIEGSVQRLGDSLRVSAQLVDAINGRQLWAERYDRSNKEIFAVQDAIVQAIAGTLAVRIDRLERDRALRKDTANLAAYDYFMRGQEFYRQGTQAGNLKAREMFRQALKLDPRYALAYAALAETYLETFLSGWTEFPGQTLAAAHEFALQAIGIDEANNKAHCALGLVYMYRRQYELAVRELERALELNPNDAFCYVNLGRVRLRTSELDAAIAAFETAYRLDPSLVSGRPQLAIAYYLKKRYDQAILILEQTISLEPDDRVVFTWLAASYARAGRMEDAARAVAEVRRRNPFFTTADVDLFRDPAHNAAVIEGLRLAGFE